MTVLQLFKNMDIANKVGIYAKSAPIRIFLYIDSKEDDIELTSSKSIVKYLSSRFDKVTVKNMLNAKLPDPTLTHIWLFTVDYKNSTGEDKQYSFNLWHY